MSAYIVQQATINKIVSWISHEFRISLYLRQIAEKYALDVERSGWEQEFAQAMYQMNIQAVNERYNEENPKEAILYTPYPYGSRIAAFKALQCWLYQCTEGDVPETKLYRYFEELEKEFAFHIVMDLPQYEKATWG